MRRTHSAKTTFERPNTNKSKETESERAMTQKPSDRFRLPWGGACSVAVAASIAVALFVGQKMEPNGAVTSTDRSRYLLDTCQDFKDNYLGSDSNKPWVKWPNKDTECEMFVANDNCKKCGEAMRRIKGLNGAELEEESDCTMCAAQILAET